MTGGILKTALRPQGLVNIITALDRIEPGQRVVYHTGRLSYDRHPVWNQRTRSAERDERATEIDAIGERAYALATKERRADLTQVRDRNGFQYIATGKPWRRPTHGTL